MQAIGKDDQPGAFSNTELFIWTDAPPAAPDVPWPAHPLPPVNPNFNANIKAVRLPFDPQYPVGIQIGDANLRQTNTAHPFLLLGHADALVYLYKAGAFGPRLFPVALYRYQVPNANFPSVSGDVTQVSPLMEKNAWQQGNDPQLGPVALVHDPFIGIYSAGTAPPVRLRRHPSFCWIRSPWSWARVTATCSCDWVVTAKSAPSFRREKWRSHHESSVGKNCAGDQWLETRHAGWLCPVRLERAIRRGFRV